MESKEEKTAKRVISKKKKILIALVAFLAVVGIACGVTAGILSKKNATAPDGTNISGIEREWKNAQSSNIDSAPDTTIKALILKQIKANDPKAKVTKFNRMKTYSDFRIYDMSFIDSDKSTGSCLILVYIKNSKATLFYYDNYKDSAGRAKLLSEYIKGLDNEYEKYAKQAQAIDDKSLIYNLK